MEEKKKLSGMEWVKFLDSHPVPEIHEKLRDVLLLFSNREVANTYFKKPSRWLYEKLVGYDYYGNPVEPMSSEEVATLKAGLLDVAERIRRAAEKI